VVVLHMNSFEKHEIAHLSPSSCNLFVGSPAMFVLQKCLKRNFGVGPAAHRGTSVESGIAHGLMNPSASITECSDLALDQFRKLTALAGDHRTPKEAAAVPEMVQVGLRELRPYGPPTSLQGAVSYEVEGLGVPLIGYYDFEWESHGVLTDLKTSFALPGAIKTNHARQVSLYKAARGDNLSARVTYVTPKKSATYQLENSREHLDALCRVALTIQKFLSTSEDPLELASMVTPDIDGSFYFNDPMARAAAYEVWGV